MPGFLDKGNFPVKLRNIKTGLLLESGAIYRIFVICVNAVFFWLGAKRAMEHYGPIGASLIWNAINMGLYYLYHYWFARLFKIGKE